VRLRASRLSAIFVRLQSVNHARLTQACSQRLLEHSIGLFHASAILSCAQSVLWSIFPISSSLSRPELAPAHVAKELNWMVCITCGIYLKSQSQVCRFKRCAYHGALNLHDRRAIAAIQDQVCQVRHANNTLTTLPSWHRTAMLTSVHGQCTYIVALRARNMNLTVCGGVCRRRAVQSHSESQAFPRERRQVLFPAADLWNRVPA
jgi:hypothetical protein